VQQACVLGHAQAGRPHVLKGVGPSGQRCGPPLQRPGSTQGPRAAFSGRSQKSWSARALTPRHADQARRGGSHPVVGPGFLAKHRPTLVVTARVGRTTPWSEPPPEELRRGIGAVSNFLESRERSSSVRAVRACSGTQVILSRTPSESAVRRRERSRSAVTLSTTEG
jgi:hypothetical protein